MMAKRQVEWKNLGMCQTNSLGIANFRWEDTLSHNRFVPAETRNKTKNISILQMFGVDEVHPFAICRCNVLLLSMEFGDFTTTCFILMFNNQVWWQNYLNT